LLVAITVVLAAVLYVLISGLTSGGASTVPIGTTFAFGSPSQQTYSTNANCGSTYTTPGDCYSIGIQSAGSSATTGNIHFAVLSGGVGQSFLTVAVYGPGGGTALSTYTYNSGGSTWNNVLSFSSTDTLVLTAAAHGTSMSGWTFEAIGVGSLSGTTSVVLP
jgi:hypothetical protein